MINQIKCKMFSFVYRKWLWNEYLKTYDVVTNVFGWRLARTKTSTGGSVKTVSPCFTIFGVKFD